MKAYIIITGALFGLLAVVHVWRLFEEGLAIARNPLFFLTTILAAGLSLWSLRLVRVHTK
jgi:hypothetical protein